jgi:polar amino acid transport system permease protein
MIIRPFGWNEIFFIVAAVQWTVLLSLIAFAGGGAIGILVALLRTAPQRPLRVAAGAYILLFQGTPLLMQLFMVFFGLGLFGVSVSPWTAAAVGLSLNAGAFLGEIWRGSIQTVPRGQHEAAMALGLRYIQRLALIVLPQALRIAVAPTVGFLVQLVKSTSLASVIGFTELARAGQLTNNATFRPFLVFSLVAALYFALCWPLSWLSRRLETRLARGIAGPVQVPRPRLEAV